jgi:hypothetical protein
MSGKDFSGCGSSETDTEVLFIKGQPLLYHRRRILPKKFFPGAFASAGDSF